MLLADLVKGLNILATKGNTEIKIEDIAYDSRKVRRGSVFVCIDGTKMDGHKYISSAVENGAFALLVQKDVEVPENIAVVRVEDTRYAMAYISDRFYNHPSNKFKLIGVTGTKGKTTITYMIKWILESYGRKVGLIGTISNMIGDEVLYSERTTPESRDLQALFSEMVDKEIDSVAMEVSSHALELHRVSCSDYDIGVFTNLSRDHLDFHMTFENYLNAKIKLFSLCKKGLVNIDNSYGDEVVKKAVCNIFTYGINKDADLKAINIIEHPDSVEFDIKSPWGREHFMVNIPGRFSVYNALAAIGCCRLMNIPYEHIKMGLESVGVPGRAEVVPTGRNFSVVIDYAHTPDSLENILTTIKGYTKGRLICLFGCGGDRDRSKRPEMGEISGCLADYTIITSDNPRTEVPELIINDIEKGIKKVTYKYTTIVDRAEAIKYAIKNARMNDTILLAGKGHETYQVFKDKTIHFDEREVVRESLKSLYDNDYERKCKNV